MKAVILAGGHGTRISEETHLKPKPMIEIGGKPVLWHIMKEYSSYGINDFVICCGYKGYMVKEYFANYFLHMSDVTFNMKANSMEVHHKFVEPWTVTLVDTGLNTMTGGRLKKVKEYVQDDTFCFTYGDGLSDVNISKLIDFHKNKKTIATVTSVQPPGRFGTLDISGDKITNFKEKPAGDGNWINAGYFVLEPSVFDYLKDDSVIWEREPLEKLAQENQLTGFKHTGFWQPLDTLRDKNYLEGLWDSDKATLEDLVMNQDFWKNKTVLVTGHTGFKGSWMSIILKKFGANVIGFSKDIPTKPSMFEITNVGDEIKSIIGNINDSKHIQQVFDENKPDIVIHMAAQAIVRESYKNPLETFSTNVLGTANILDAIRNSDSVKVCIIVTSDKSYRKKMDNSKYSEDDPMGGFDPYSCSKGCAELVTSSYRNSFFNPSKFTEHKISIASVRAGNVIGGGDWGVDRLVPDIMRGIQNNSSILIRNPESTRPWQFVLDPLFGYILLAEKMWEDGKKFAQGWNFGPTKDDEKPVKWIMELIKKNTDKKINFEIDSSSQLHEEKFLRLDCTKVISELGWKSKMDIEKTLMWTLKWYLAYIEGKNMKEISEKQIDEFIAE